MPEMRKLSFSQSVIRITARDPRYHAEAYALVRDAVEVAKKLAGKKSDQPECHVTPSELLEGIRIHVLAQFGPMALTLLHEWGVCSCGDLGEIVFNMIEAGCLSKSSQDTREDFDHGYHFDEAFRQPFLPSRVRAAQKPAPVAG